jgi:ribonuclease inhibitor
VKIRFTNSSLRVRITPNELERIQNREPLELAFGLPSAWTISLLPTENTVLETRDGVVIFGVSNQDAASLAEPAREGVYFEANGIRFYIEKDFPCEHPRTTLEESTETFGRNRTGIEIDVGEVQTTRALHVLLRERLDFPEFYGHNWDAFWDAITGLVQMPAKIKFLNWEKLEQNRSFDARMLKQCLSELNTPNVRCEIEYA